MRRSTRKCRGSNGLTRRSYWDYDALEIVWNAQDNYEIVRKVGRGKYSEVFEGVNIANNSKCVIKVGFTRGLFRFHPIQTISQEKTTFIDNLF